MLVRKVIELIREKIIFMSLGEFNIVQPLDETDFIDIDNEIIKNIPEDQIIPYFISFNKLNDFENRLGFDEFYNKGVWERYYRKIAEYYLVYNFLLSDDKEGHFKKTYIDGGGSSSPWVKWLRNNLRTNAFVVDISKAKNDPSYYIQSDIRSVPFADSSVDCVSFQSSIETFNSNVDMEMLREMHRVLKKGGECLIIPIYLHKEYYNCYGVSYYKNSLCEPDAKKAIRLDFNMPFTRLYDVEHLKNRLLTKAVDLGFDYKIIMIQSDMKDKLYSKTNSSIYLRYAVLLTKK